MSDRTSPTRRDLLTTATGLAAAAAVLPSPLLAEDKPAATAAPDGRSKVAKNGRINHSVCLWCYRGMTSADMAPAARRLGLSAIDLLTPEDWHLDYPGWEPCRLGFDGGVDVVGPFVRALAGGEAAAPVNSAPTPEPAPAQFDHLVRIASPHTLLSQDRLRMIYHLARHTANLPGDVAELGVYRGGVSLLLAGACPGKRVHAFDTFAGIPNVVPAFDGHANGDFADSGGGETLGRLRAAGVDVHVGVFPGTACSLPPDARFCFAHCDADTYRSTLDFLDYFYRRTVPGGVLVFDDYKWHQCPGVDRALREFLANKPERPIETAPMQCAVIRLPSDAQDAPPAAGTFWDELVKRWHPADPFRPDDPGVRRHYETKHALVKELGPRSIVEVGVRSGYSAFAMLFGNPDATYQGIDNDSNDDGGVHGHVHHARKILKPYRAEVRIHDSQTLADLPIREPDLVHVDGSHFEEGCYSDLRLSLRAGARRILVDDYDNCPGVKQAVHRLMMERPCRFRYVNDRLRGFALLSFQPRAVEGGASQPSPAAQHVPLAAASKVNALVKFTHGLGDSCQLTVVLKHIRRYYPDWSVDVWGLWGKHTAWRNLCRRAYHEREDRPAEASYDRVFDLGWSEPERTYGTGHPSTKAERCLIEQFRITPSADLCGYSIQIGQEARAAAIAYLEGVGCMRRADGRLNAVLLHYQGNTSQDRKDLPHDVARAVCDEVRRAGHVPVILDWDRRSPIPEGRSVFCPDADHPLWRGGGTGDAETITALIDASALFVGIDSGPQKCAGATETRTLAVWTGHHPLHYYGPANNVLHLVPRDHASLLRGDRQAGALAFDSALYRHATYKDLAIDLPAHVAEQLGEAGADPARTVGESVGVPGLTVTEYGERYYVEHREAGIDYLAYGGWQERYGRWAVRGLGLAGRRVLDVGCACGAIVRALREAGADAAGVDVNEHAVALGRQQWPDMAGALRVCDAVNLHPYADATFDAVHSMQVAEHWRPELVPLILRELARVTRPGGLLWMCMDTEEVFARNGRESQPDDPTHVCIKPLAWWHEQLAAAGWVGCDNVVRPRLTGTPEKFLEEYDWDWVAARRPGGPASSGEDDPTMPTAGSFWDELVKRWHPNDPFRPDDPGVRRHYETKHALVKELGPRSIVEIGVRSGYSAFAMLFGNPDATYQGIDNDSNDDGGAHGHVHHARKILKPYRAEVRIHDSRTLADLPIREPDLVHVDGSHSEEGCYSDLCLSVRAGARRILVDDYGNCPGVKQAVHRLMIERPCGFRYVDDGLRGFVLLSFPEVA